jgi:hypothetical protein
MWNQEQQIIQSKLSGGEQLLWFGRPRQGFFFRKSDAWIVPFSLLWFGFAIFWNYGVWTNTNADTFFRLFGLPFLFVGFYYVFGRFIVDIFQRRKTFYGLTNERIIIVSGLFNQTTKYIDLKGLSEITFEEKSDGLGTITFGRDEVEDSGWFNSNQNNIVYAPNFEQIPNAKNVYEIIRNAQKLLR